MMCRMKRPRKLLKQVSVAARLQELAAQLELLIPEVKAALEGQEPHAALVTSAARTLTRAAEALSALVAEAKPGPMPTEVRALLEGTTPLMSMLGSRLVLSGQPGGPPKAPSAAAQALAVLLEDPKRTFTAAEVAAQLELTEPVARTTLHRLVQSGHATRPAEGKFRAKGR
jgi:hypothetical protein